MAQVRLNRWEVGEGELPDVCMRCGADATTERRRSFSWHPQWVYLLILIGLIPAAIVAMILTKRMAVYVPFCEAHKNHWSSRLLLILGSMLFVGLFAFGSIALLSMDQRGRNDTLAGIACVATMVLVLGWLVLVLVVQNSAIRATEITDKTIRLTGVNVAFIEALEQEDEDRPRRPRRPKYDDEDEFNDRDDVRRRRKRADDYDDDEER